MKASERKNNNKRKFQEKIQIFPIGREREKSEWFVYFRCVYICLFSVVFYIYIFFWFFNAHGLPTEKWIEWRLINTYVIIDYIIESECLTIIYSFIFVRMLIAFVLPIYTKEFFFLFSSLSVRSLLFVFFANVKKIDCPVVNRL